jgi:dTDP-glucose 4,6-dehydratase
MSRHVAGQRQIRRNLVKVDLVEMILKKLDKPENLISFVTDRLGHDRRYAIDSSFAERELK